MISAIPFAVKPMFTFHPSETSLTIGSSEKPMHRMSSCSSYLILIDARPLLHVYRCFRERCLNPHLGVGEQALGFAGWEPEIQKDVAANRRNVRA